MEIKQVYVSVMRKTAMPNLENFDITVGVTAVLQEGDDITAVTTALYDTCAIRVLELAAHGLDDLSRNTLMDVRKTILTTKDEFEV